MRMDHCEHLSGKGSGAGSRYRRTTCILIAKTSCERVVWVPIDRPYPGLKIICQHYVCLQSIFAFFFILCFQLPPITDFSIFPLLMFSIL